MSRTQKKTSKQCADDVASVMLLISLPDAVLHVVTSLVGPEDAWIHLAIVCNYWRALIKRQVLITGDLKLLTPSNVLGLVYLRLDLTDDRYGAWVGGFIANEPNTADHYLELISEHCRSLESLLSARKGPCDADCGTCILGAPPIGNFDDRYLGEFGYGFRDTICLSPETFRHLLERCKHLHCLGIVVLTDDHLEVLKTTPTLPALEIWGENATALEYLDTEDYDNEDDYDTAIEDIPLPWHFPEVEDFLKKPGMFSGQLELHFYDSEHAGGSPYVFDIDKSEQVQELHFDSLDETAQCGFSGYYTLENTNF
jgi:hypothetical protein